MSGYAEMAKNFLGMYHRGNPDSEYCIEAWKVMRPMYQWPTPRSDSYSGRPPIGIILELVFSGSEDEGDISGSK